MRCCGTNAKQHMRIGYVMIFLVAVFFSGIFLYYGHTIMSPFEDLGMADCSGDDKNVCLGVQTIYRLSFALLLFFFLMFL
jgi:hypothetical protein